jgi:hypothetical protein
VAVHPKRPLLVGILEALVSLLWTATSCHPLKELKASNPVEVAEYAVANRLLEEPAFSW